MGSAVLGGSATLPSITYTFSGKSNGKIESTDFHGSISITTSFVSKEFLSLRRTAICFENVV